MKVLKCLLPILILSMVLFLVSACGGHDATSESEPAKETASETTGETKSEISEEEMLEIGEAIATRNFENFKSAIAGFYINARTENGKTILMRAVSSPYAEILEYLIENGADVNARDYEANTALIYAVNNCQLYSVEVLIENGADIDAKDGSGNTPLILAASLGGTEEDIFTVYEDVQKRYEDIVELLIDSGAELNWKNRKGRSALSAAKEYGLGKIENMLQEAGALEGFYWFDDIKDKFDELYVAMEYGTEGVIQYMERVEIGINSTDNYGVTPIMYASTMCKSDIVEYLIDNGADINAKDYYDMTALIRAADRNCIEIVEMLIDNGADINIRTVYGWSALDFAKRAGHTEIIELLEEAGAE